MLKYCPHKNISAKVKGSVSHTFHSIGRSGSFDLAGGHKEHTGPEILKAIPQGSKEQSKMQITLYDPV
jgi:hypothetical protein